MRALCVFDLDHTLVRSPLDLEAMRAEIRALAAARGLTLGPGAPGWTVAETISAIADRVPELEAACWAMVSEHETRALAAAAGEPGAREALQALQAAGFGLAVWTNNTRGATECALRRAGLRTFFSNLVTRDEAPLKPHPGGLALLRASFATGPIWVVGDSWVDGVAAQAGGVPFIAYRADPESLRRRGVAPRLVIEDLRALPDWLVTAPLEPTREPPPPDPHIM